MRPSAISTLLAATLVIVFAAGTLPQLLPTLDDLLDGLLATPPETAGPGPPAPASVQTGELPRPSEPPLPHGDLVELAHHLDVDDQGSPTGGYDRQLFRHWTDTNDTGCDTRGDILNRDFTGHTLDPDGCRPLPATGTVVSLWDGHILDDPADVDVDHIIALADAWGAGASTWTATEREIFANDPANLIAVSATSNRDKAAHGPDRWLPTGHHATCWYLDTYVRVRLAYQLTVTTSEHAAILELAPTC